jgi:hypothetical protein
VISVGNGVRWILPWSDDNAAGHRQLNELLALLHGLDPDGVFVTWTGVLDMERINPLASPTSIDVDMIPLGWQERAPFHSDHIADLGIEDLYTAIATDPDVYVASVRQQPNDHAFAAYVAEHYGYSGLLRPVTNLGPGGRVAVYDVLIHYAIGDGMLVETMVGGSTRELPIDPAIRGGLERVDRTRVTGWAADPATGRTADLVVVIDGAGLRLLDLPGQPRPQLARELGLDATARIGFDVMARGVRLDPATTRVFAVFGDEAVELSLPSGG